MRGSPFHNSLVAQIERVCRELGAMVRTEYRIVTATVDGFVDLFVIYNLLRIAIEVELTVDRIRWDVLKAIALNADLLIIVFPTKDLVSLAQKRVDGLNSSDKEGKLPVACLTMGAALQKIMTSELFDQLQRATDPDSLIHSAKGSTNHANPRE